MLIKDMTTAEIRSFLYQQHIGRLAFIIDNKPYIVPLFFKFYGGSFYSLTTEGQKVEAMRENPKVSILFDQVDKVDDWRSVMVHGEYVEIVSESDQAATAELLNKRPEWWEPAYVRTIKQDGTERRLSVIYFHIIATDMTGHQAQPST